METKKTKKRRRISDDGQEIRVLSGEDIFASTPEGDSISIDHLPINVLVIILSKLPVHTILDCKLVCKALYLSIWEWEFSQVYMSNPACPSVILCPKPSRLDYHFPPKPCFLELWGGDKYTSIGKRPKTFRTPGLCTENFRFCACANGLVCFADYYPAILFDTSGRVPEIKMYVSNPILGEYALIPQPNVKKQIDYDAFGFGYSPKTGEYKVFRIVGSYSGPNEAEVCTVGADDCWRSLKGTFPAPGHGGGILGYRTPMNEFCSFRGAFHWLIDDLSRPDYMYSFDMEREKVRPFPPPSVMVEKGGFMSLEVLQDYLCVFQANGNDRTDLDIWRMMVYGDAGSWVKERTIDIGYHSYYPMPCYPKVMGNSNEIFMCAERGSLISYDTEEKRATELAISVGAYKEFSVVPYTPCFLSLKDVLNAEDVEGVDAKLNFVMKCKRSKNISLYNWRNADAISSELPTFILEDIFSRVPRNTIAILKRGCKAWYNLISEPHFAKKYFRAHNFVGLVLSHKDHACSILELNIDHTYGYKTIRGLPAWLSNNEVTLLGSCNGFICFSVSSSSKQNSMYICNPLMGECAALPEPLFVKYLEKEVYGFGFSPVAGNYVVLRIVTRKWGRGKIDAHLLRMESDDGWKIVGTYDGLPPKKRLGPSTNKARLCEATLNGALHWIAEGDENSYLIYSFDMSEEVVNQIPHPPFKRSSCWPSLGVLKDCLCVFQIECFRDLHIWRMNYYRNVNSWTTYSISTSCIPGDVGIHAALPISTQKNCVVLMYGDSGSLISYFPKEKTASRVKIEPGFDGCLTAVQYIPSFLSLKAAVKEGRLELVNMK